jgi:hypothetical protein
MAYKIKSAQVGWAMTMPTKMKIPFVVNTISIGYCDDQRDGVKKKKVFVHTKHKTQHC